MNNDNLRVGLASGSVTSSASSSGTSTTTEITPYTQSTDTVVNVYIQM